MCTCKTSSHSRCADLVYVVLLLAMFGSYDIFLISLYEPGWLAEAIETPSQGCNESAPQPLSPLPPHPPPTAPPPPNSSLPPQLALIQQSLVKHLYRFGVSSASMSRAQGFKDMVPIYRVCAGDKSSSVQAQQEQHAAAQDVNLLAP